jgi:hypothetical protein
MAGLSWIDFLTHPAIEFSSITDSHLLSAIP